jgi:S-disulfanyl-L-cysteine oxidoreductase SoxD
MFKLDRKLILSASVAATLALLSVGCMPFGAEPKGETTVNGKATIDGGVVYPVVNDKTGPYYVNPQVAIDAKKIFNGRVPTANELKAWDKDVMPDGTGLPEGEGSVEDGEALYEAQCVMCHGDFGSGGGGYPSLSKGNAYDLQKTLTNNRYHNAQGDGPVRVFGSYWPKVSTLWWYIRDGMPHPMSKTLNDDEVYALTAYILNINEMEIDGEEVDDEYVLDREKMLKIKMPNEKGFEPNIDGPNATDNVRAFYANPTNFGAQKVDPSDRCMTNCQDKTAKVTRIAGAGISEFLPPMATARDLPKKEGAEGNAKKNYEESCMMCHADSSMGAPAFGDAKAWAAYTAKGMDKVYHNGINGINGMPPKGGSSLSDTDFKSVVDYIINNSK